MAFTLLHTADLHLGKSFSDLPPERAGQRRADLLATLTRLCRVAREKAVDLLCITGDLFDRSVPAMPLLASARRVLADASVPVLLVPGNHDPLENGSPYRDTSWPAHVMIAAAPGWQRMPVPGAEVWAFGYTRGEAHRNPWQTFPGCGEDAVLALHASCLSPALAAEASYYPFTPHDIPACGYLALGHHHRRVQIQPCPAAWYAGAPEPLEAETTPASALLVTLDGRGARVEPIPVATRRHRLVTIQVTGLSAGQIWERALAEAQPDDLLTLVLTGLLPPTEPLDLPALRAELSARSFAANVSMDTVHLPAPSDHADGVLGAVQMLAQERLAMLSDDDPARRRLEQAVRYATLALEGKL